MNPAVFKASAPGNIFFFGEHAAVYGKPAICASVDRRTSVELKERQDRKSTVISDSFGKGYAELSENSIKNKKFEAPELSTTFDFIDMLLPAFSINKGFEMKIS